MPERTKRFFAVGLVVVLVMVVAGVFAAARPVTPLPSPASTPTSPLPETISVAAANPLPTASATPTEIQATPTSTLIPLSSSPFLTSRYPTIAELEAYLVGREIHYVSYWNEGTTHTDQISPYLRIMYEDLNGDKEADLILWQHLPTFLEGVLLIFLWNGDYYLHPLAVHNWGEYGGPGQKITLADWTGDQIPEIILDISQVNGGAGLFIITWLRYVIHCQAGCQVAWSGKMSEYSAISGSRAIEQATFEFVMNEPASPMFKIGREGFSIPGFVNPDAVYQATVKPATTEVWTWNGIEFVLSEQQIVVDGYEKTFQPTLSATSASGDFAYLDAQLNEERFQHGWLIYNCVLVLNDIVLNEQFSCTNNISWITWQDITNDGQEELIFTTVDLTAQQHLWAYQWDGTKATLIADITAPIIRSDLYGVRVENIDGDEALEILAGQVDFPYVCDAQHSEFSMTYAESVSGCWYEQIVLYDTVYDWDGTMYVDRGRVP